MIFGELQQAGRRVGKLSNRRGGHASCRTPVAINQHRVSDANYDSEKCSAAAAAAVWAGMGRCATQSDENFWQKMSFAHLQRPALLLALKGLSLDLVGFPFGRRLKSTLYRRFRNRVNTLRPSVLLL